MKNLFIGLVVLALAGSVNANLLNYGGFETRRTSIVVGTVSTLVAGFVDQLGTIFDMAQFVLGLFAGPIFVCVLLSVTKIHATRIPIAIGL